MKYRFRNIQSMSICSKPLALFILGSLFSLVAVADAEYSPYVDRDIPMDVYWGDTHLHTNMSQDVGTTVLFSDRSMSSIDAYRFALGETITTRLGTKMRRQRPLDFLVIADHAENIGLNVGIVENNEELMKSAFGQRIIADYNEAKKTGGEDEFSKYFLEKPMLGSPLKIQSGIKLRLLQISIMSMKISPRLSVMNGLPGDYNLGTQVNSIEWSYLKMALRKHKKCSLFLHSTVASLRTSGRTSPVMSRRQGAMPLLFLTTAI